MIYKIALMVILLLPSVAAVIGYMLGKKSERNRDLFNVIVTGIELLIVILLYKEVMREPIELVISDIMGTGLYLKLDGFRYIFVFISAFIWFLTTIYSTQYLIRYKNRNRYYAFFMLTLASTVGIFLSENILNLFTFFEIMSFTSYALIIHDQDEYALDAGKIYIGMAIAGGMVLLMGLFLLYEYTGVLNISQLGESIKVLGSMKYLISFLIIVGFGVKASIVPLHVWVPKVYPAAPTPASAVLSGVLLKTGLFGIMITTEILMQGDFMVSSVIFGLGLANMFLGGLLALFQRNIKRVLAYSGMSQAGYILVGIGLCGILKSHKAIAVYGTLYHMINHAVFKVLLFMGTGIIYMVLHEVSINKIRGFGKHKKILKGVFFIGLCAIIGMPGFNGFISKTLLHEALYEAYNLYPNTWMNLAKMIFTISSSFTIAYMLKIFVTVFMEKDEKYKGQLKDHIKKRALLPMVILSIAILYIGMKPESILVVLNGTVENFGITQGLEVHFYTASNIKSSFLTIFIGIGIYIGFVRGYLRRVDGKEILYVNPSLRWFNLERNVYAPVLKGTFLSTSVVFHVLDRAVVSSVHYIGDALKGFSGMKIKGSSYREFSTKKGEDCVIKEKRELYSLKEVIAKLSRNMNSLMYSVFVVAAILAVMLVLLVF
ncbi:complex I subunit 5 family protein [Crassaminicella profunda]|uniref:complex I subunit 5 family protein n=1 Tax=Crassaminicella profunda TaxID=1286698 RepID=UPI001CA6E113|nr:complex I subunit 5 family protein [Crassaminicella profunda]QZY55291.1 complex I subunit 5 family protein [Crassaminicella profunda]